MKSAIERLSEAVTVRRAVQSPTETKVRPLFMVPVTFEAEDLAHAEVVAEYLQSLYDEGVDCNTEPYYIVCKWGKPFPVPIPDEIATESGFDHSEE